MKKAMENLRWVAYEEYSYATEDSEDEEVKANDATDSIETEVKTEDEISARNLEDDDGSESAEFHSEAGDNDEDVEEEEEEEEEEG